MELAPQTHRSLQCRELDKASSNFFAMSSQQDDAGVTSQDKIAVLFKVSGTSESLT
jgi:hypothetical protein